MKKIIALSMCLILCVSLIGCDNIKNLDEEINILSGMVDESKNSQEISSDNDLSSSKEQKTPESSTYKSSSQDSVSSFQSQTNNSINSSSEIQEYNVYIPSVIPEYTSDDAYENVDSTLKDDQNVNEEQNICKISTVDDLKEFANTVNCGYSYQGEQVTLEADIDLLGIEWTPIGTTKKPFKGTFLGNGHTINNLTITAITEQMMDISGNNAYIGLFGYAEDAIITGINLENVNICISNDIEPTYINVGSVVGYMMSRNKGIGLTKCRASGNISVSLPQEKIIQIGGIAGGFDANEKNTFYNLQFLYSSVNIASEGYHCCLGGIAGILNSRDSDASDSYMSDLIYIGNINDEKVKRSNVGGLCGLFNSGYRCDIKNSFVKLTLTKTGFNEYTELKPNLGVIIGDQCVGTAELGFENIYGYATLNDKFEGLSFVGRTHNNVFYKKCVETDKVPEDADIFLTNWNLSDRSLPTFDIEIY